MDGEQYTDFRADPSVKDFQKWLVEKNRAKRQENDRIWGEYNRLLRAGKSEPETRAELADRFGWSVRRIGNLILKRTGSLNEAARVEAMSKVIGTVYFMSQNIQEICDNVDAELDELENRNPDDWVDFEMVTTKGGKLGDTEQTKKKTVRQARQELEDRKLKAYAQFVDSVSKLTQRNIVQVNIGDETRAKNIEDLDEEIKILERQLIKGDKQGD